MLRFVFDNIVLISACFAAFCAGGFFMPQRLKDAISGVAPELRAALKAQEQAAKKAVLDAQAKALADVAKSVAPAMPKPPVPANPSPPAA